MTFFGFAPIGIPKIERSYYERELIRARNSRNPLVWTLDGRATTLKEWALAGLARLDDEMHGIPL